MPYRRLKGCVSVLGKFIRRTPGCDISLKAPVDPRGNKIASHVTPEDTLNVGFNRTFFYPYLQTIL